MTLPPWLLPVAVLALLLVGVVLWGLTAGVRRSRRAEARPEALSAQELSALAQPYRGYLGEALAIQQDIAAQAASAPKALAYEFETLAWRLGRLVKRALPRAQHGTRLAAYLLELTPTEPQYQATQADAERIQAELAAFTETLRTVRGKVYQVVSDAESLAADPRLRHDLDDALIEVSALEEAFGELDVS